MKNGKSGWGWLGLIAVVALIGAGWLYQREGGRIFGGGNNAAPDPAAQNPPSDLPPVNRPSDAGESTNAQALPPRSPPSTAIDARKPVVATPSPQAGVVVVKVTRPNQPFGPWLYVNGKLHRDYSIQFPDGSRAGEEWKSTIDEQIELPPGRYVVGLVSAVADSAGYDGKGEFKFPLQFQEFSFDLTSGEKVAPEFKRIDFGFIWNDQFGRRKFLGKWAPEYGKDYIENEGEYFDRLRNTVELNMRTFEENEIHAALEKVQHENPTRDVVMVSLPVACGGARELNASQISLIVDWLKDVYCPIYQAGPPSTDLAKLDLIPNPNDPEWFAYSAEAKQAAFKLFEGVRRNRSRIEDLKAICRKLIQASPPPGP